MNHARRDNIRYLQTIPAVPSRRSVLFRLGYSRDKTVLGERDQRMLEDGTRLGRLLCQGRGVFGRCPIAENNAQRIILENGAVFESASLARLLADSDEMLLMAATVGAEVCERIATEIRDGNAGFGLILDAVASETADSCLDWMVEFVNKLVRREARKLTRRRYSPGYGDLSLDHQQTIFRLLELERLDLALSERQMLIPEKSVIAIAGMQKINERIFDEQD
jgi:hypothetical protein